MLKNKLNLQKTVNVLVLWHSCLCYLAMGTCGGTPCCITSTKKEVPYKLLLNTSSAYECHSFANNSVVVAKVKHY
jgi:hypothetical protein